jgi:hypothetical protein
VARTGVKRFLLVVLIVSLVAAALVGAAILVIGSAGDLEGRVLLTVLLLGFFSLTGLCAALRFERGLAWLGWAGILASLAGLVYAELLVWQVVPLEGFDQLKPALALGIASAAVAYASLVLLARGPYHSVNVVAWLTVALVVAIAGALVALLVTELEPPDNGERALGAAGVLTVLGTMLAPLLRKFLLLGESAPSPGRPAQGRRGRHRARAADRRSEVKGV